MAAVAGVLGSLEDEARSRVIRWAAERYGVSLGGAARPNVKRRTNEDADEATSGEEVASEAPQFEHFAELYNVARPKTEADKAIVAAYWFQVINKQPSFQSAQLNTELKHLGHVIANVTDAVASNQNRKPARIIQLRKSGSARQARKTYKLTTEGIVYVEGMIGHGR